MLRLDGHLMHVVYNDVLAKTLPSPISTPSSAAPGSPPVSYRPSQPVR
jgi:hypothetical protein